MPQSLRLLPVESVSDVAVDPLQSTRQLLAATAAALHAAGEPLSSSVAVVTGAYGLGLVALDVQTVGRRYES